MVCDDVHMPAEKERAGRVGVGQGNMGDKTRSRDTSMPSIIYHQKDRPISIHDPNDFNAHITKRARESGEFMSATYS